MEVDIKDRIRTKADELFYKYGIRSVTMDEIANQLGISKKTIYLAYKDKDQLVDAVFADLFIRNEKHCTQLQNKAKDAVHEGFLAMQMIEDIYGSMNPVILFDLQRNHPVTFEKFRVHKYRFLFDTILENLKRGKKQELFREDIPDDVVARLRLENIMMPFDPDIFPKNRFKHTELQKQLIELHLFSIVTPKGYKLILKYKQQLLIKGS